MLKDLFGHIVDVIVELLRQEEIWLFLFIVGLGGILLVTIPSGGVNLIKIILSLWWLWGAFILFRLFLDTWIHYHQEDFKRNLEYILLELRIPREIKKSPQAMEQVLRALHALRTSADTAKEEYMEGVLTPCFSLEVVSFGGEVHFYIRCLKKQRNLVEAAFFSYYIDVEVVEVPDYIEKFPQTIAEMNERDYDFWGAEIALAKDDIYPVKSYVAFESPAEEKQFDPISVLLEFLGKAPKENIIGIQVLISPATGTWPDKWKSEIEKLQKPPMMEVATGSEEGGTREVATGRTPGQVDILKAVEESISKPAFLTLIRYIYIAPKSNYYHHFARLGMIGVINQYSALNLNSFRTNYKPAPSTGLWYWPHIFPKTRKIYRKQRTLYEYLNRVVPPEKKIGRLINSYLFNWYSYSKRFYMNVEGLATFFHLPTFLVLTAPHIKRVESRKTGPPSGLAIFGEEGEIEKYK